MFIDEPNDELWLHFLICEFFFWVNYCIAFLLLSFLCVYILRTKIPTHLSNIILFSKHPKHLVLVHYFPWETFFRSPLSFSQYAFHMMGVCQSGASLCEALVLLDLYVPWIPCVLFLSIYPHFGKEQSLTVP